ncbi:hypothetical protein BDN72DRAFT_846630 [Pluteus cervinus]|uniref:Uncharacterized protein n=1 Tax=Pluteus cervinus TaxID=181527 RepID=A0ACD3AEP3_9AGAR|nr:hypothetical protein BDN72DRAFT_846630 [Pluteus cervinus]
MAQFVLLLLFGVLTAYQLLLLVIDLFRPMKKRRHLLIPLLLTLLLFLSSYILNATFLMLVYSKPDPMGSTGFATAANVTSILSDFSLLATLAYYLWDESLIKILSGYVFVQGIPFIAATALALRSVHQEWLVNGGVNLATGQLPDPTGTRDMYMWYMGHNFTTIVLLVLGFLTSLPMEVSKSIFALSGSLVFYVVYLGVQYARDKPPISVEVVNRWFILDILVRGTLRAVITLYYSRTCVCFPTVYG